MSRWTALFVRSAICVASFFAMCGPAAGQHAGRYETRYGAEAAVCQYVRGAFGDVLRGLSEPPSLRLLTSRDVDAYEARGGPDPDLIWPDTILAWRVDLDGDGARDLVMALSRVQQHQTNPPYLISDLAIVRSTNARAEDVVGRFVGRFPLSLAANEDFVDVGDLPSGMPERVRGPVAANGFFQIGGAPWRAVRGETITLFEYEAKPYILLMQGGSTTISAVVMRYGRDHMFDIDCVLEWQL